MTITLPEPCVECGGEIKLHFPEELNDKLTVNKVCFNCNFWHEFVEKKDHPKFARIKGQHWCANDKNSGSPWNGMGGRTFIIKWNDGRIKETNDLWHQGTIPVHFLERLPDNAEFIEEPAPIGHGQGYLG